MELNLIRNQNEGFRIIKTGFNSLNTRSERKFPWKHFSFPEKVIISSKKMIRSYEIGF
jgi:hypothetical protein